ncbi:hypothetical protein [Microbispora sp. CSR-4]|uniref:hypothetical protein n=1 Tax=Microbispora sp. CSR-4 TaxID=2592813 RepID=UPI0011CC6673|nr:hypothetical protein [Microbispora sp. CSR-4]
MADTLDAAQLRRIIAVHRGFLYQHLYAVGCLLRLEETGAQVLLVERDEDLELLFPDRRLYLQVKTRDGELGWSDLRSSVERFDNIRKEHEAGRRSGTPALIVVSNTTPGVRLLGRIQKPDWPSDITLLWPNGPHEQDIWLPTPGRDVEELLQWCVAVAGQIPFGSLTPETLIWKLAARVQYACTGAHGHSFAASDLTELFEQFVEELQAFPEIPEFYRPQDGEPTLFSEQRARLIVGFSGAGKTTWAAQAAAHCPLPVTYFDVGGLPPAAVAGSLARELAARHLSGSSRELRLSSGAGLDVLRAVHLRLSQEQTAVAVILDNTHQLPASELKALIDALPTARFILLGQPWPDQTLLAAQLGITIESLPGWHTDAVAAAFSAEGCSLDYPTARRVLAITAGLPLYVLNSAHLTRTLYAADGAAFCDALQEQMHTAPTAQELILEKTFEHLTETARTFAALLALAEVPLTGRELLRMASAAGLERPAVNARALRELASHGVTQTFADGHIKLHDAVRPMATVYLDNLAEGPIEQARYALCGLLEGKRDLPRLARWMRLLAHTDQIDTLLDLTTLEGFYEGGYPIELRAVLADVAQNPDRDIATQFDARNALITWAYMDKDWKAYQHHLRAMEALIETAQSGMGKRERAIITSRQLTLFGRLGDLQGLERAFDRAIAQVTIPSLYVTTTLSASG